MLCASLMHRDPTTHHGARLCTHDLHVVVTWIFTVCSTDAANIMYANFEIVCISTAHSRDGITISDFQINNGIQSQDCVHILYTCMHIHEIFA